MQIAGNDWEIVIVHGRQFVNGEEFLSLIDPQPGGGGDIRITDTVPLAEQLELAAGAALAIFSESARIVPVLALGGGRSCSDGPPCPRL